MKTRELIAQLQSEDPSGDLECCVHNADIYFVSTDPAYYDGCLQVLRRDESRKPYYNIVGADYVRSGAKVVLHLMSVGDVLLDDPEAPVGFIGFNAGGDSYYEKRVEDRRVEVRRMQQDMINGFFVAYVKRRLGDHFNDDFPAAEVEQAARSYAEANLREDDPIDADLHKVITKHPTGNPNWPISRAYLSQHDKRCRMWDRQIEVSLASGKLELVRKAECPT